MVKTRRVRLILASLPPLVALSGLLLGARVAPPVATAPGSSYVRGVALGLFASDPAWNYRGLVDEVVARGATDLLVVVNGYQADRFAAEIAMLPGRSPDLETVRKTLRHARAAGLRTALMPVVRLSHRTPGDWRGRLTPADGLDAWFASYARFVMPLAEVAAETGAVRFVVGSELGSLEPYGARWRALIHRVRARFAGRLTYSANWDRADRVPFWDALDEIGTTAYFPLATEAAPSPRALREAWEAPRRTLDALGKRHAKPVLITEVGYPSQAGAHARPWDETLDHAIDLQLQARLYQGMCDALLSMPRVDGFYVWNWFGFGGPRDSGYSPRGKPAASTLERCFARGVPQAAHREPGAGKHHPGDQRDDRAKQAP